MVLTGSPFLQHMKRIFRTTLNWVFFWKAVCCSQPSKGIHFHLPDIEQLELEDLVQLHVLDALGEDVIFPRDRQRRKTAELSRQIMNHFSGLHVPHCSEAGVPKSVQHLQTTGRQTFIAR